MEPHSFQSSPYFHPSSHTMIKTEPQEYQQYPAQPNPMMMINGDMGMMYHQQQQQHHQQQQQQQQHHHHQQYMEQPQPSSSVMPPQPTKTKKKKVKQEKITDAFPAKKRRKFDRFHGMPEEEVLKRTLPDHLDYNLDIAIVGINPGLFAAYKGHHYAGPGNHFWKCLYLSGLIPEPMTCMDDFKLHEYGIGFTNIVTRTTRGSADLTRKEIKEGGVELLEKMKKYQPKIACFNGKGIYEIFSGRKDFEIGKQPDPLEGTNTAVFVMPSSSARCSQFPRATDKVPFYLKLKELRDSITGRKSLPPNIPPAVTAPPDKKPAQDITVKIENQVSETVDAANIPFLNQEACGSGSGSPQIKQEPISTPPGMMVPNHMGFQVKQEPSDDGYIVNATKTVHTDFLSGDFIDSIPMIQNDNGYTAKQLSALRAGSLPTQQQPSRSFPSNQFDQQQVSNIGNGFQIKQEGGTGTQPCTYQNL